MEHSSFLLPLRLAVALPRRFHAETAGVSAVEFGLGSAIMFLLVMGIMDVSRAVQTVLTLEHVTKVGGRFAIIAAKQPGATVSTVQWDTLVKMRSVAGGLDSTKLSATLNWSGAQVANTPITINTSYPHTFFFNNIISATPYTFTTRSTYVLGN